MKKINFRVLFTLIVLAIIGCAKTDLGDMSTTQSGESYRIKVQTPTDTKVAIDGSSVEWTSGDQLYIIPVGNDMIDTMHLFEIDPATISSDGKSAEFVAEDVTLEDGSYIAVTGAEISIDEKTGKIEVSRVAAYQAADGDDSHLESDWFMKSNIFSINQTDVPSIVFENMQSVLSLKLKMNSSVADQTISKLLFKADQSSFSDVILIDSDGSSSSSSVDTEVTLNFTNNATLTSSTEYTAYLPIIWNSDISEVEGSFTITILTTDDKESSISFDARELTSGKLYTASLSFDEPIDNITAEKEALIAFYNATGGDNWTTNTNWCSDEPLSDWYGVTTNDAGQVNSLYFWSNNLSGDVADMVSSISSLSNLTGLVLIGGNLTGSIPTEIGNLTSLKSLAICDNQLSGSIPSEIGNLVDLEQLNLGTNQLTGTIPSELGNLSSVWYLQLSVNDLSGEIPSELGSLNSLTQLYLMNNNLSGEIPSELGSLNSLTQLFLMNNNLSGEIPSELGNLTSLHYFDISYNQMTGAVPQSFLDLSYVDNFVFNPQQDGYGVTEHESEVDRDILIALYNAAGGENWLDNTNWCSDEHISEWYGVTVNAAGYVTIINLKYNNLSGEIPSELGGLTGLTYLYLFGNNLTGEIPAEIGNLTNLKSLTLYDNQLTGEIPAEIGNLTNLTGLSLFVNNLTGEIPAEIGNLTNLKGLTLYSNQLTGEIPEELGKLANLSTLNVSYNQLTGVIPQSLQDHANYSSFTLNPQQDGYGVTEE